MTKITVSCFFITLLLLVCTPLYVLADNEESAFFVDRFAVIHDGNFHDPDDIGAVTMNEALIWQAGVQNEMVHLQFSNHLGANDTSQAANMNNSATRALSRFVIDPARVFDCQTNLLSANNHLSAQINASTAQDRLSILIGGPWETMAQAFDIADPAKHQFVDIISHNGWNDFHKHNANHRNKDAFDFQYGAAGKWAGVTPPRFYQIFDGNNTGFKAPLNDWNWLNTGGVQTWFTFTRTQASGFAQGDMSDSVMVFWFITGNDKPTMTEIRTFFGL